MKKPQKNSRRQSLPQPPGALRRLTREQTRRFIQAARHELPPDEIRAACREYNDLLIRMVSECRVWTPEAIRRLAPVALRLVAEDDEIKRIEASYETKRPARSRRAR